MEGKAVVEVVAGVDGGGTKTAAMILDGQGRVLGAGEGGPSTYGITPEPVLRESIRSAVEGARRVAGLPPGPLAAVFIGLGNVVSEPDRLAVRRVALELGLAASERTGVDHDCRVALAGGLSGRPGIVQIAGTGASCFGRNAAGQAWRAGGWGPLIDDEGSSYWLGIQAMRAAALAFDGRGQPTALSEAVSRRLQLSEMNELMNRLYAAGLDRTEIAALAPLVYQAAAQGDGVAAGLIAQGCAAMADCVLTVARKLGLDAGPCELAVSGGQLAAGDSFLTPLARAVHERLPLCRVLSAEHPPVYGAGLLALELCGRNPFPPFNQP